MTILWIVSDRSTSFHVTRCDPDRNMARFYSLTIQETLFGEVSLIRSWGRIGTKGQQKVDTFPGHRNLNLAVNLYGDNAG
ncbi:WGR domain-containing protein (plasmid) [Phyllobacterium sp. 628]|uniref:WGR domain-containing protein n=1 Tax=Phyllobacterium sp. 628 TaxID=2718938 RepID=UPI0016625332|nr:WGR domain-containing protein [Phyllobacterium sp. 628]QND54557.1 WGR domain-containing protein [Phyllobacterium sp. 628]